MWQPRGISLFRCVLANIFLNSVQSGLEVTPISVQESCAIATMTARCAKIISGVPDYVHDYFS